MITLSKTKRIFYFVTKAANSWHIKKH